MKRTGFNILFFLLLSCSLQAGDKRFGFHFLGEAKSFDLQIEVVNNLIIVPILVENKIPLNFILDTGVKTPILFDETLAKLIRLESTRTVVVKGWGKQKEIEASVVNNVSLQLGDLKGDAFSMLVLPPNSFDVSNYLGHRVHGLIGYDVFKHHQIEIDYRRKFIRIFNPQKWRPKKLWNRIDIDVVQAKAYVQAVISGHQQSGEVRLFIDTGSSMSVALKPGLGEKFKPPRIVNAHLGTGLSGDIEGEIGRLERMDLGKFSFAKVITAFPNDESVRHFAYNDGRAGSLGGEILRRFRVIFDYPNGKIYLKRNAHFYDRFSYNKTGLHLVATGLLLNEFTVDRVHPASEAFKVIEVGDRLLSINGYDCRGMSLNRIYSIVNSKRNGRKVRLLVERNGELKKIKLKVADLI